MTKKNYPACKSKSKTVADAILLRAFIHLFPKKIRLDISCKSAAYHVIHTQCQALFSQEIKQKYF